VRYSVGMRVEARDAGKGWAAGSVTLLNPLKVKLDSELSGCSWDEVRPLTDEPKKVSAMDGVMKKIQEDAQALVQAAKDEALTELKASCEGVRLLASLTNPSADAYKEAKQRVGAAIKSATEKGVSKEELIEASSASKEADLNTPKPKGEERVKAEKKPKKEKVVIEFDNPAVGEACKEAAEKAKEEGKTIPEIITAAVTAAAAVPDASPDDMKKVKKSAMAIALEGSSSSSSSSSSGEEEEPEIDAKSKAKAKREGIAAVFYFDALKAGLVPAKTADPKASSQAFAKSKPAPPPEAAP